MLTLKEMVETAIRNQPFILQEDKRKGAPLCYCTKDGRFVIEYPDGTVETYDKPRLPEMRPAHA
ncbi:hypothetical protein [Mailhella sp.]|uniref:hypothetical protein n=1 Tax=Mailhella sp. TaxID=1981029 RepID=UPI0040646B96